MFSRNLKARSFHATTWSDVAFMAVGVAVLLAFIVGMAYAFNLVPFPWP